MLRNCGTRCSRHSAESAMLMPTSHPLDISRLSLSFHSWNVIVPIAGLLLTHSPPMLRQRYERGGLGKSPWMPSGIVFLDRTIE